MPIEMSAMTLAAGFSDYLLILMSTDWFLPYWPEIGINIDSNKKVAIQRGCRRIVDRILDGADEIYLSDFSYERRQETCSRFQELLRNCSAEMEVAGTWEEWNSLSHRQLSVALICAALNSTIASSSDSAPELQLNPLIRLEADKEWKSHELSPSIFREVCLNSTTEWDIHTRAILASPRTLVNQLWRVLVFRHLRSFWAHLQRKLTVNQLQELRLWYRAMVIRELQTDRLESIQLFME